MFRNNNFLVIFFKKIIQFMKNFLYFVPNFLERECASYNIG